MGWNMITNRRKKWKAQQVLLQETEILAAAWRLNADINFKLFCEMAELAGNERILWVESLTVEAISWPQKKHTLPLWMIKLITIFKKR